MFETIEIFNIASCENVKITIFNVFVKIWKLLILGIFLRTRFLIE